MISLGATVVLAGLVLFCKAADDRGKAVPAVQNRPGCSLPNLNDPV